MNDVVRIVDEPVNNEAAWMLPPRATALHKFEHGSIWLGRNADDERTALGRQDDSHVLLCAMNRSGKGRALITNNLLMWPGSLVCNDPKGENASVTASRRGQGSEHTTEFLDQKVCVLDSHRTATVSDDYRAYYNPLAEIHPDDPNAPAKADAIAEACITRHASKDPTWDDLARNYIKALILHIVSSTPSENGQDGLIPETERDLITLRRFIQRGDFHAVEHLERTIDPEKLAAKPPDGMFLLLRRMKSNQAFDGIISDEAASLLESMKTQPKYWNSIRGTANQCTAWIDDQQIRTVLRAGKYQKTFTADELKTNPKGVSVFICLKVTHQEKLAPWPRIIMNMILEAAQEDYHQDPATGHHTLLMADEFASMDRMKILETAAPAIAGAGVKLFMVVQNLTQIKSIYGENWEAFVANAGTHIYYGFNDNFTADYVSKRLGEIEVVRKTRSGSEATAEGETISRTDGGSRSKAQTTNTARTINRTTGSGGAEGSNSAYSSGSNVSNGWGPSVFHMSLETSLQRGHNTNRSHGSNRQRSWQNSTSRGTTKSFGTTDTETETWSKTVSQQRTRTVTTGWGEQIIKRPLASIDELMRLFGNIEDDREPNFPGIGLVSTANERPMLVQKIFYDLDADFEGLFDPHPKHGYTTLSYEEPQRIEAQHGDAQITFTGRKLREYGVSITYPGQGKTPHQFEKGMHLLTLAPDKALLFGELPSLHVFAPAPGQITHVYKNDLCYEDEHGRRVAVEDSSESYRLKSKGLNAEFFDEDRIMDVHLNGAPDEHIEEIITAVNAFNESLQDFKRTRKARTKLYAFRGVLSLILLPILWFISTFIGVQIFGVYEGFGVKNIMEIMIGAAAFCFFIGLPTVITIADFVFRKLSRIKDRNFDIAVEKIVKRSEKEVWEAVSRLSGYQSVELRK